MGDYLLIVEVKFNELGGTLFSLPVAEVPLTIFCPGLPLSWILLEAELRW